MRIETLAVMQPYFLPYAGYFRLFAATDRFVVYDCVQFPRRGWVHRNRLPDVNGALQWLTLPLRAAPFEVRIDELRFADDAIERFKRELRRFPTLARLEPSTRSVLCDFTGSPVDYLERTLAHACARFGLPYRSVRSSALQLPIELKGEQRILAICRALGAKRYVNSPGGRELYNAVAFERQGIELCFLPPWRGDTASTLQTLAEGHDIETGAEIRRQSRVESTQPKPT